MGRPMHNTKWVRIVYSEQTRYLKTQLVGRNWYGNFLVQGKTFLAAAILKCSKPAIGTNQASSHSGSTFFKIYVP